MSERLAPNLPNVEAYFGALEISLSQVPELKPGLDLALSNSEYAAEVYGSYVGLISRFAELSDNERDSVRNAKEKMLHMNGNFGTASQVSADDLLLELEDGKDALSDLAISSINIDSTTSKAALKELVHRMEGGHKLKLNGKQPNDDDPESRKVIWGHTMITNPQSLVHFMVCHYLERYFAVALLEHGSLLAQQKDFLLNTLVDVLLVDGHTDGKFKRLYEMWSRPKQHGGLGWITQDREESYSV